MGLLLIIGLVLAVVTALSMVVESLAEARGRNRWAWVLASLVGLAFAGIGWLLVVGVLIALGPGDAGRKSAHAPAPATTRL